MTDTPRYELVLLVHNIPLHRDYDDDMDVLVRRAEKKWGSVRSWHKDRTPTQPDARETYRATGWWGRDVQADLVIIQWR